MEPIENINSINNSDNQTLSSVTKKDSREVNHSPDSIELIKQKAPTTIKRKIMNAIDNQTNSKTNESESTTKHKSSLTKKKSSKYSKTNSNPIIIKKKNNYFGDQNQKIIKYTHIRLNSSFLIKKETDSHLILEPNVKCISDEYSYSMCDLIDCSHFKPHFIFVAYSKTNPDFNSDMNIIILLITVINNEYHGYIISQNPTVKFTISDCETCINANSLMKLLHSKFDSYTNFESVPISDTLINELISFDKNKTYKFEPDIMHIGIIYAKSTQTDALKMLHNRHKDVNTECREFLKLMAVPEEYDPNNLYDDHFYVSTKIKWYLSTQMNEEDIRCHIGNVNCIIIFHEGTGAFDIGTVSEFGKLSQIFIFVQYHKPDQTIFPENRYRIGVVHKKMKYFKPLVPGNYLFETKDVRDFILTKIYNGMINIKTNSHISHYYLYPREKELQNIISVHKDRNKKIRTSKSKIV